MAVTQGKHDTLTLSAARLENVLVVIEVFDVRRAQRVVFRLGARLVVRFLGLVVHLDLVLPHAARRSLLVEALAERLAVLEREARAVAAPVRDAARRGRLTERRDFLQIDDVDGNVAQIIRHANLSKQMNEPSSGYAIRKALFYQLSGGDGHVLNAAPRNRNRVERAARLPAVHS